MSYNFDYKRIIGEYREGIDEKFRRIELTISRKDLLEGWDICGSTANFFSSYAKYKFSDHTEAENSASTIINELIENAAKYSTESSSIVLAALYHIDQDIYIKVANFPDKDMFESFIEYAKRLYTIDDFMAEYMNTMMMNVDNDDVSGIGVLLVSNLLSRAPSFKFEKDSAADVCKVTVQTKITLD